MTPTIASPPNRPAAIIEPFRSYFDYREVLLPVSGFGYYADRYDAAVLAGDRSRHADRERLDREYVNLAAVEPELFQTVGASLSGSGPAVFV